MFLGLEFLELQTPEGLKNALDKPKVYIRGVRIQKEAASTTRGKLDKAILVGTTQYHPLLISEVKTGSPSAASGSDLLRRSRNLVSVEGLPLHIPLLEVEKALSVYGEVIRSEIKHEESRVCCAHMEFQVRNKLLVVVCSVGLCHSHSLKCLGISLPSNVLPVSDDDQ